MYRKYIRKSAKQIIEVADELIKKKDAKELKILKIEIGTRKKRAKMLEATLNKINIFLDTSNQPTNIGNNNQIKEIDLLFKREMVTGAYSPKLIKTVLENNKKVISLAFRVD